MTVSAPWITRLPKTDLHLHLDGSLRTSTLLELAAAAEIALPATEPRALEQALHAGERVGSLEDYLKAFGWTLKVLQQEANLERVAFEVAEDAAQDGAIHIEVRFAPFLHSEAGLTEQAVLEAVSAGLRRASTRYPDLSTGIIVCGLRHLDPGVTERMATLAADNKHLGVVGVDLAGPEAGFPPSAHRRAFEVAQAAGLGVTIHAGEAAGPESIADALDCGALRIGHGCRLREDATLLEQVKEAQIPLECCPLSNVQTGAVDDLATHPLLDYLRAGLRVTVNTDNTFVSKTSLSTEFEALSDTLSPTPDEMLTMARFGVEAAFVDDAQRALLRQRFDARVAALGQGH